MKQAHAYQGLPDGITVKKQIHVRNLITEDAKGTQIVSYLKRSVKQLVQEKLTDPSLEMDIGIQIYFRIVLSLNFIKNIL